MSNGFTPTQSRIMAVLSDGRAHSAQELQSCLYDDLGVITNVKFHITMIRKILRPLGQDIVFLRREDRAWYAHVRILSAVD